MLAHKTKDAARLEAELHSMMHMLAAEGQQQGVEYVSVLQVRNTATASSVQSSRCAGPVS